ncbi:MAG: response regulator transcription factor [Chloroflexi bacterium]|nr:response regulator transcription factor [Chloroflexota bacterium]
MSPSPTDLRVLVVARDPLARAGLAALLGGQPGFDVVGQGVGGDEIGQGAGAFPPEVVLWDLGWEPQGALEELAVVREEGLPVLALVSEASSASHAWTLGARGILRRDADASTLAAALGAVAQGLAVLDPELAVEALATRPQPAESLVEELTPRERQVLALLAEGLTNKAIAERLRVSEHTVKFHVNAILGKLAAQSRTEAVVRATRLGLLSV